MPTERAYEQLRAALSQSVTQRPDAIELLKDITNLVNDAATHNDGRDLVIRVLAVVETFPKSLHPLIMTLVRNVGLFPYMTERLKLADVDDKIAYEMHKPGNEDSRIVFHSLQAKIFHRLLSGSNVVLSASTSVGKSAIVDELLATGKYKKVVIIVPTLALIDETRRRLLRRFGEKCSVITHPSQEEKNGVINVYVLTQERVLNREDLYGLDLFVIDEFYKVNLASEDDPARAVDLNLAFHRLADTGAQFYLLGPNIHAIRGLESYEYHFVPSEFSTVAVDIVNLNLPTKGDARDVTLLNLCATIDGPTIIYCQSPRSASDVALHLVEKGGLDISDATADAVSWINSNYDNHWSVSRALERGIGIHHGGVPRSLQQYFIRLFNQRKIRFLVCTSTIIEGVNTVAKNVIIYDRRKNGGVLEHFTYKNIEGRAGRMNEYFVGRVFALEKIPEDQSLLVEFPLGSQDKSTPFSLLLDLEDKDLKKVSQDRISELFSSSSLSPETLRTNRHLAIDVQESIASEIRSNIAWYSTRLSWRRVPDAGQLETVCQLIYSFIAERQLRDYGVHSGKALAWHLNTLRIGKDLSGYVRDSVAKRNPDQDESDAVENALKFVRNVICESFPRHLMAVDAIQSDVLGKAKVPFGSYLLFAEQSKSLFLPSLIFALDEYGIPIQTAVKLEGVLLPADTLDVVLAKLVQMRMPSAGLSTFELDILKDVRATLKPGRRQSSV